MSVSQRGLLALYIEHNPSLSETEFTDWFNAQYTPSLLKMPGLFGVTRYKAIDAERPLVLALIDITSLDTLQLDAPTVPHTTPNIGDPTVPKLPTIDRQIYRHIVTINHPDVDTSSLPGRFTLTAKFRIRAELETYLDRFYTEEHMDMLSKVPGWLRGRRYKLVNELSGGESVPYTYLAIHDWDRSTFQETSEWKEAMSTPWTVELLDKATSLELKMYEHTKA